MRYSLVMYGAFAAGWGIPAIALVIALVFSGVSFRFGSELVAVLCFDVVIKHGLTLL
jgi:hypothetical protein